jgi:transcriptional regulator with PAS, ATPase and Fis domain
VEAGDDDGVPRAAASLILRHGDRLHVVDLEEGSDVVLGREPGLALVIDDAKVSREHARFGCRGGVVYVEDLGSRNGTRVNDRLLQGEEQRLTSGDVVRIGPVELMVAESRPQARTDEASAAAPRGVVAIEQAMVQLFDKVRRVARTATTVLILGETGAGKEVVAEQIHLQSPRGHGPFVRLNCGALPRTLIESELFGHEKGAFTGADRRREGYLEAANGGTLFLDEIGELQLETQAHLLRVLENQRFMRVGGTQEIRVDVRLVAATHRDLRVALRDGTFREDLYFRLASFVMQVPPLRERQAEVLPLAELFVQRLAQRMGVKPPILAADAAGALRRYGWPGNVRELRNAVEHAMVLADDTIRAEHLPESLAGGAAGAASGAMRARLEELERSSIEEALKAEGGNQTRAAKRLGISRRALIYKLTKYDLRR